MKKHFRKLKSLAFLKTLVDAYRPVPKVTIKVVRCSASVGSKIIDIDDYIDCDDDGEVSDK